MDEIEEGQINTGFDRGIDYLAIKEKLITAMNKLYVILQEEDKKLAISRLVYNTISLIQLKCGSRISEAVKAFIIFINKGIKDKIIVRISKTGALKVMKSGEKKRSKVRYRHMVWPKWISNNVYELLKNNEMVQDLINSGTLKKRVLDYLARNFECNTHSLRYACINFLINEKKIPINVVSKYVGHGNVQQMITYTQQKHVDGLFDLD